jgi:hypothetical protein
MMGVERVDSSSRTKAAKNSIDRGVAGRNMTAKDRASVAKRRLAGACLQDCRSSGVQSCDRGAAAAWARFGTVRFVCKQEVRRR